MLKNAILIFLGTILGFSHDDDEFKPSITYVIETVDDSPYIQIAKKKDNDEFFAILRREYDQRDDLDSDARIIRAHSLESTMPLYVITFGENKRMVVNEHSLNNKGGNILHTEWGIEKVRDQTYRIKVDKNSCLTIDGYDEKAGNYPLRIAKCSKDLESSKKQIFVIRKEIKKPKKNTPNSLESDSSKPLSKPTTKPISAMHKHRDGEPFMGF